MFLNRFLCLSRHACAVMVMLVVIVLISGRHALACEGDLDGDTQVDGNDVALLLLDFGECPACPGDLDNDGTVGFSDLALQLLNWGECPVDIEWTLLTYLNNNTTTAVDSSGAVVKTWMGSGFGSSIGYLKPDGTLVRPCVYAAGVFHAGGRGGRVQIFSTEGVITNDLILATSLYQQHHDISLMPNGDILCIVWESHTLAEAIAAGRTSTSITGAIWSESIMQIHPTGYSTFQIVWTWRLWDHLVQDANASSANYASVSANPERVDINYGMVTSSGDWIHMNSIDFNPTLDQIVVSSRSLNEVWVLDHSTTTAQAATHTGGARGKGGDLLYRWGNPIVSKRGTITNQYFSVVHSATWIDEGMTGAGDIMAFDNGDRAGSVNDWSSVVQITPPRDVAGGYEVPAADAFGPTSPSWLYGAPNAFYGGNTQCGAFRTLGNTTLITLTNSGTIFEVNELGQTIFTTSVTGQLARAARYRMVLGAWVGP